jgi:hypothetical protein
MPSITPKAMQAFDDALALREWAKDEAAKRQKNAEWAHGLFCVVTFMVVQGAALDAAKFLALSQASREG